MTDRPYVDPLAGRCSLVSSTELMFSTWAGAKVQHVAGCDGQCDMQRRLDAAARLRQQSIGMTLRNIDESEDD